MIAIGKHLRTALISRGVLTQQEFTEWLRATDCYLQPFLIEMLGRPRLPVCPVCKTPFEEDEVRGAAGVVVCPSCTRCIVALRMGKPGNSPTWLTFEWAG